MQRPSSSHRTRSPPRRPRRARANIFRRRRSAEISSTVPPLRRNRTTCVVGKSFKIITFTAIHARGVQEETAESFCFIRSAVYMGHLKSADNDEFSSLIAVLKLKHVFFLARSYEYWNETFRWKIIENNKIRRKHRLNRVASRYSSELSSWKNNKYRITIDDVVSRGFLSQTYYYYGRIVKTSVGKKERVSNTVQMTKQPYFCCV